MSEVDYDNSQSESAPQRVSKSIQMQASTEHGRSASLNQLSQVSQSKLPVFNDYKMNNLEDVPGNLLSHSNLHPISSLKLGYNNRNNDLAIVSNSISKGNSEQRLVDQQITLRQKPSDSRQHTQGDSLINEIERKVIKARLNVAPKPEAQSQPIVETHTNFRPYKRLFKNKMAHVQQDSREDPKQQSSKQALDDFKNLNQDMQHYFDIFVKPVEYSMTDIIQ